MTSHTKHLGATLGVLLLASVVGCGPQDPASRLAELNGTNLQRVANLYLAYQIEHDFRGPKDEGTFQEYIRSLSATKLERIGVAQGEIDNLFVSERDGQPFKIRYKVQGSMMGCEEPVVFEAEGESGKRKVGFLNMTQREVEASEYERLFSKGAEANPGQRT